MIEFEIKYSLKQLPEGLKNLKPFTEKSQTDVYYDTKDYSLIKNGNFMRVRNNYKLDFKIDIDDASHLFCKELSFSLENLQDHISELNKVFEVLHIPSSPSFSTFAQYVSINNFQEIATINKKRTGYSYDNDCNIFIDEVDNLGVFLEAEIVIDNENISLEDSTSIKDALINKLISSDILTQDSSIVNVGYVELYLLKHNKFAYDLGKFKL